MYRAVIFGAGKIGRGFIGQLLYLSDFEITFVDVYQPIIDVLNEKKQYHVHVLGDKSLDSVVTGIKACNYDQTERVYNAFKEADIVFVSVGGDHLVCTAQSFAQILNKYGLSKKEKNIIVCENWKDAANTYKTSFLETLNNENKEIAKKYLGISEAVLMRTATQPDDELAKKNPEDVWVQNFWYLPIDKSRLIEDIPKIKSVELLDHFGNFLIQKMYTNNTSNAVIAYTGYLLGYNILAEAANSPEISRILDKTYQEINKTLVAGLGVSPEQQADFSKKARAKYTDWTIVDKVIRHAKDPIRKLGPEDRLIAPCRMALEHGIFPETLIDTVAKAIYFDEPTDKSAMKLKKMREEHGIEFILQNVCQLKTDEKLYGEVLKSIAKIRKEGLLEGHE